MTNSSTNRTSNWLTFGLFGIAALAVGFATAQFVAAPANQSPNTVAQQNNEQAKTADAKASPDRAEIETIVKEYLLANPELIAEMQIALEQKQKLEAEAKQKEYLASNMALITNSDYQIEFGDPNAPVTIVEFFDYNCHFCQRAMADMQDLLKDNPNIRFVLREFPVLGEQSIEASRVSLAFSKLLPEKYGEFHLKLLGAEGVKNGDRAIQIAKELGADENQLLAEMEKPEIIEAIGSVYQIADPLGITGTPSYVIGDQVVFGAVGYDRLDKIVDEIATQ